MQGPKKAERTAKVSQAGSWTPTVSNLVVLVVLEIVAYCALRWAFRTVHGG